MTVPREEADAQRETLRERHTYTARKGESAGTIKREGGRAWESMRACGSERVCGTHILCVCVCVCVRVCVRVCVHTHASACIQVYISVRSVCKYQKVHFWANHFDFDCCRLVFVCKVVQGQLVHCFGCLSWQIPQLQLCSFCSVL